MPTAGTRGLVLEFGGSVIHVKQAGVLLDERNEFMLLGNDTEVLQCSPPGFKPINIRTGLKGRCSYQRRAPAVAVLAPSVLEGGRGCSSLRSQ